MWESAFYDFSRILRRVGEHFLRLLKVLTSCGERFLRLLEDFTSCGRALSATFEGFNVVWGSAFLDFWRIFTSEKGGAF